MTPDGYDAQRPQARFRRLVDRTADGVVIVGEDGRVRFANRAAETMLGRDASDLIGELFGYPVGREGVAEIDVIRGTTVTAVEMHVVDVEWQGEIGRLAILRALPEDAVTTDESLRDPLAIAAHELRTPLTSILGASSTLLAAWERADEAQKLQLVEAIYKQGNRLLRIVTDLMTMTRLETGVLDPSQRVLQMTEIVEQAVDEIESPVFDIACPRGLSAYADADHVHQILVNLMTNAMRYGDPPYLVEVTGEQASVQVAVIDHGPGVPEDFEPNLFDKFRRATPRKGRGIGLGLAMSRELARANGGDVGHAPNEPSGARFTLVLPVPPVRGAPD